MLDDAERNARSMPPFDGVVYQIYPRSFRDADGDGVGDLVGIRQGLDHLTWLGVDALWLSPIYRSPMADFGYDVSDHTDVDPVFGTLDDADDLIGSAHERGLGVWLDWVPNHTSDRHPWFQASRSSREDPHRDWYVWRDPAPDGGPPNNWVRHFARESAWTLDEATGQYYLHHFLPQQPDVNWDHPDLRAAQLDVLRFWLDHGVDGFRADVVHLIGQDRGYPDDPEHLRGDGRAHHHHHPSTREHLRAVRRLLDARGATMVGEVTLPDPADQLRHVGPDGLHLSFVFEQLHLPWDAGRWAAYVDRVDRAYAAAGQWPAWILGNHDVRRVATRLGSPARARVAATVLLTLRGVPFLYAGDELGLEDAVVPEERVVDPGGRDGCRAPLPWRRAPRGGWTDSAWLPSPPDAAERSVEALRADGGSILHLHRRLLTARRWSPTLRRGGQEVLALADGVLAFRRSATEGDDDRVTVANLTGEPVAAPLPGDWDVTIASDGAGVGARYRGTVGADAAVVLRPAR